MSKHTLYFATNRRHRGRKQWQPTSYGADFSRDGMENLRFGKVTVEADAAKVARTLRKDVGFGTGDGESLAGHLSSRAKSTRSSKIDAFAEKLDPALSDENQLASAKYGSQRLFKELREIMEKSCDVLVYVHGYNVSWADAVGSALALQEMLNLRDAGFPAPRTQVVLFSWPSNGQALPFVSYKSDRADAWASGKSFGRSLLKLRDFLFGLIRTHDHALCGQSLHLLTHSMGNYVMQSALERIAQFTPGTVMPRLFDHVFLCSADVDDDVLEPGHPLGRVHEIARNLSVYYNRGDAALHVSDYTKGNPERLGTNGAARPANIHSKIHQIDCSPVVGGLVEHSYYLWGNVNRDLRLSLAGVPLDAERAHRDRSPRARNAWVMRD